MPIHITAVWCSRTHSTTQLIKELSFLYADVFPIVAGIDPIVAGLMPKIAYKEEV